MPESLRLEYLDVDELADNPANWRLHGSEQLDALQEVIAKVGWAGAMLYNERTERLIDGHARKKVTEGKVPVLIGDWSEEQEQLILATLDPLAAMASADAEKLESLLDGIEIQEEGLQGMLNGLAMLHSEKGENDPDAEWEGMPGYDHEDITSFQSIHIHFKDQEAVDTFAELIGQTLLPTTRSRWFPHVENTKAADKVYT